MNQEFNQFYEKELKQVITEIDMKELGVIDMVFSGNSVNIKGEIISSLTSAWNNISDKKNYSSNLKCSSMDNCLIVLIL